MRHTADCICAGGPSEGVDAEGQETITHSEACNSRFRPCNSCGTEIASSLDICFMCWSHGFDGAGS